MLNMFKVLLFFCIIGLVSSQSGEQLSEVLMLSMQLIGRFQEKFPFMSSTFSDLHGGIQNFYALGLKDEQLVEQADEINIMHRMLVALPPTAVSNAKTFRLLGLLNQVSNLRRIFPSEPNKFKQSVDRYQSQGAMVDAAYPPLFKISLRCERQTLKWENATLPHSIPNHLPQAMEIVGYLQREHIPRVSHESMSGVPICLLIASIVLIGLLLACAIFSCCIYWVMLTKRHKEEKEEKSEEMKSLGVETV